ncbi:DUF1189 domain-containing protein [Niallia sp. 01092]|uniref:DUF1189 domain-containing protein n=1 Tax=unclassified Niallia TaxID=2837522 RepID=UPI003FD4D42C
MNIFKQFFRSIYSPRDIAGFRYQGNGKTILYLILLSLLASIPTLYHLSKGMNEGINSLLEEEALSFSIKNNELQSTNNEPTIIYKDDLTIIVDSTGTYNANNISSSGNTVALLKKEFIISTAGQAQAVEYRNFGNVNITNEEILSSLKSLKSALPIMLSVFAIIYFLVMAISKVVETLILAIFGRLFSRILGRSLSYAQVWKITAYSITLPIMFFLVMDSLQTIVPNGALLNWFVGLFIVFLSIKEIPLDNKPNAA